MTGFDDRILCNTLVSADCLGRPWSG